MPSLSLASRGVPAPVSTCAPLHRFCLTAVVAIVLCLGTTGRAMACGQTTHLIVGDLALDHLRHADLRALLKSHSSAYRAGLMHPDALRNELFQHPFYPQENPDLDIDESGQS